MNQRLSNILKENNILKGNQYAGLPGNSTFEPIRIINELIQDANENDKDLWLLALDMSKAYDRVNIYMLEKALERIRIPKKFINLILELFTGRKNQVFTAGGLTPQYDVLVGIDQGEIISPLLWCIYYDPLLCEIQKRQLGYKLSAEKILNIYEGITEQHKIKFPGMAYMDDTNFLTNSKEELEEILRVADEFYNLNDIQINKDKSELLLRSSSYCYEESRKIQIQFGNHMMNILPTPKDNSIRILGVWFNAFNKREFVLNQCINEIKTLSNNTLRRKVITDKQTTYIFNMLILPRIEYRSQVTIFTEEECNKMMVPYRKMLKNKLKFAKTAPNSIIENSLIYNIRSIWANQIQAKITNFFIQLNDKGTLGKIMDIRLLDLQSKLWIDHSPLLSLPYTEKQIYLYIPLLRNNFILKNLFLMKKNKITTKKEKNDIENNKKIIGGRTTILDILGVDKYVKLIKNFKKCRLMFFDQLTNLSGTFLLTPWQLLNRQYINNMSKNRTKLLKRTIKKIKNVVVENHNTLELKTQYKINSPFINLKGFELISPFDSNQQDFIIFWNNGLEIGEIVTESVDHLNIFYIKHYKRISDYNDTDLSIINCTGCQLNMDSSSYQECIIELSRSNIYILKIKTQKIVYKIDKYNKSILLEDVQYIDLKEILDAHNNFKVFPQNYIPSDYRYEYLLNYNLLQNLNIIDKYIDLSLDKKLLFEKQNLLLQSNNRTFISYTDGSVRDLSKSTALSTFGSTLYNENMKFILEIVSNYEHSISVAKSETLAVLITLLILPRYSIIKIFTDSAIVVDNFRKIKILLPNLTS
jgi:hypothetical protein